MSSNQDNTPTTGGAIANPPSTEHHQHTGYDERHQVPTIQNYLSRRDEEHKDNWDKGLSEEELQRAKDEEADRALREQEDDKGAIMKRMQPNKNKPTDEVKERKGERTVKDPTTGHAVTIKDAEFKDYPEKSEMSAIQPAPSKAAVHHSRTSPSPASPTNISLLPFPPAAPMALGSTIAALQNLAYFSVFASFVLWLLIAFRRGFWVFAFRTALCVAFGAGGSFYAWKAARGVEKETEKVRWEMHRQRAEKFAPPFPESVEWLNALIETFWGLINPEMFLSTADMVEDIMQASLPALVDAVRISDIGQGTNPFRIISMRGLPDHPTDPKYPREEWIDQGDAERAPGFSNQQEAANSDQAGDYVNLEVAFAYSAKPGKDEDSRSKNIHMLLEFFIGAFDWLHIPIPLWIQVESLVGTVRLRLQFIPVFPYVRNCTFTFMGVPAVEVSVVPMTRALPNVLDLPMVSSFVKMAIAAGTAEFVAPKSMTINLQEMLSGAAIGDTQAIGAFVVTIHYGEDLSAQDRNGTSDPYIVLAYAKFGKPLYSTRIILGDLNPVYEETCVLLLTADEVKSEEALSLMLWDSDEHTSDDLIGRVKVDVKELMKEPNVTHRRADALMGFEDADKMQGKLHWSVGYYEKAALNPKLEIPEEHPAVQPSKTLPEMEMRPGDAAPNPAAKDGPPPLPSPERTPPDTRWKSGILSVVIHQISNLEKRNLKGTSGKEREGVAGQDTDEPSEQTANLPSAYCEIVINDDLVYKTRVKQYTTMPFFEAGTEKFIRNFEDAVVRVVVRDSALREKDPILGIVNLPLKKLFAEASEVTRMFSLEEGQGFGRVNISLLFRPLKVDLPPNMLGWETGTVEVTAPCVIELDPAHTDLIDDFKKLTLSTSDSTEHLTKKEASITGNRIEWDVGRIRLPVYSRFQSVLTIQAMGSAHLGILGSEAKALAVLWLQELVDDEERVIRIPVLKSKNLKQLRQNYINEFTQKTHDYEIVGWLTTKVKLDAGLDEDHESAAANGPAGSQARRHALETWDRIEGQAELAERNAHANDDGHIDKEEAKAIKKANKRQDRNHQRGVHSFKPFRTARWMAEGVKERLTPHKDSSKREPTVQSEA